MPTSHHNPSDAELVRASLAGDRVAFGGLVDRYLKDVYSVAVRIVCSHAEAEDVAQDTFVRAFERLGQFAMRHSFRSWLLKIATNTAINRLRSRRNEKRLQLRLVRDEAQTVEPAGSGPDVPDSSEWQHWLSQLDESQRAALVLFHFHEMSYQEIAEILDAPINTVRTYIHRGRKRLKELMTGEANREQRSWIVAM